MKGKLRSGHGCGAGRREVGNVWPLARRVLRVHLRSSRFEVALLLIVLVVGTNTVLGARGYRDLRAGWQERVRQHREWLAAAQTYVELVPFMGWEPTPLSLLAARDGGGHGDTAVIPGWYGPVSFLELGSSVPAFSRRLEQLDLSRIVILILTLLVVFLVFDAVVGERESGTLRLLSSLAVSRTHILVAHYCASMGAAVLALAAAFGLWGSILALSGIHLRGDEWLRVLGVFVLSVLLLSWFVLLGLLVSERSRNSQRALVSLVMAWTLAVVVGPVTVQEMAQLLRPVHFSPDARDRRFELGMVPGETSPVQSGQPYRMVRGGTFRPLAEQYDLFLEGRFDAEEYHARMEQHGLSYATGYWNPVALYLAAASELAGTDMTAHERFVSAALRCQESLRQWQAAKVAAFPHRSRWVTDRDGPLDPSGFPVPGSYREDPLGGLLGRALLSAAGLLVINLLLAGMLLVRGRAGGAATMQYTAWVGG